MAAQIAYVRLDVHIRFRALGITVGEYDEHVVFPLPPLAQLLESLIHAQSMGTVYNNHGVKIMASLVNSPIG